MNRNLIFVFIFFATLSVINCLPHRPDKRDATDWTVCNTNEGTFPFVNPKMSPDPPVEGQPDTFTVSGSLPQDINANDQCYIVFIDDDTNKTYTSSTPVCGVNGLPQCPIKANTGFNVSITVQVP